ncbi:MAG: hypothetical protein QG649_74 [Patescibacteria group bacterium]|nr:hypothetical protein [Patescibacteria group bacterium]
MTPFFHRHERTITLLFSCVAFAVSALYLWIVPLEVSSASGVTKLILMYSHSVCWALLGIASLAWVLLKNKRFALACVYLALACYAAFIATLLGN